VYEDLRMRKGHSVNLQKVSNFSTVKHNLRIVTFCFSALYRLSSCVYVLSKCHLAILCIYYK